MNRQTTALLFVLCLLAVFEITTAADESKKATEDTTVKATTSGVATYSALGAIVTAVLANVF